MTLPLAARSTVRNWLWSTATTHRGDFTAMITLFVAAATAGLVGPRLLGELVESVTTSTTIPSRVDVLAAAFLGVLLVAALLRRWAHLVAAVFGERLLAQAREELVEHVVRLPLDTVEAAGAGELLGRATSDVDKLDEGLRQAVPRVVVAAVTAAATVLAMLLTSPLLTLGVLVVVPVLVVVARWYWPRAVPNYQRTLARWAGVHASTQETVAGGRTVEALGLAGRRVAHHERALREVAAGERRGGQLWGGFVGALDFTSVLPVAAILLLGGWAYPRGWVGVAELTAMVLYAAAFAEPVNEALTWLDELQVGHAALRRVLGVRELPAEPDRDDPAERHPADRNPTTDRNPTAERDYSAEVGTPRDSGLEVRGARFGYRAGREVLHGVDLVVAPGERLAVVGPSGAGKSTLGRLLAGVNAPAVGTVCVGGVPVTALPLERRRRAVMLVTQEQHVFSATLRDNLTLAGPAPDARLWDALTRVGAREWAARLPVGLDARVGAGGHPVPAATAQRLALARVLLADPAAVVLDEATSLLPGSPTERNTDAAGSVAESGEDAPTGITGIRGIRGITAVLAGRTVVAIAHRLAVARDADRIAVLVGGRIAELGSHSELLAAGGAYARLWTAYLGGASGGGSQPASTRE